MLAVMRKQKKQNLKFLTAVALCTLLSFCVSMPAFASSLLQPVKKPVVVVIDPGHGGDNTGTTENPTGMLEKEMTMITANAMYEELSQYEDVVIYMTRTTDKARTLKQRAEYARSVGADFLFSIHYNASDDHDLFGAEVWVSCREPFREYGYQFGYLQQQLMQDMGVFLRGVKTKINEKNADYYGILRESAARNLPAVIIEHCHVDEERDLGFCDTEDDLIAFGKADAQAVAAYFGLTKKGDTGAGGVSELPEADASSVTIDVTEPESCIIEKIDSNPAEGTVTLKVSAADPDSPILYYQYSLDGGASYEVRYPWPSVDVLQGTCQETETLTLQIPDGVSPKIRIRVHNQYDLFTDSNILEIPQVFGGRTEPEPKEKEDVREVQEVLAKHPETEPAGKAPSPATQIQDAAETPKEKSTGFLLALCLAVACFAACFLCGYCKKVLGKRENQPK